MTTPMRQQYLDLKAQHPDTLLLFRLGDFYEAFDEDAILLADVCEVTLTSRPVGKNLRVPLAGVPHHSLSPYLEKLMAQGVKVAIAEQVSEPGQGLVQREISQVLTPGMVTSPDLLTAEANLLAAACPEPGGLRAGLAHSDLSVGRLAVTQFEVRRSEELRLQLADELTRLRPRELLLPEGWREHLGGLEPALDRLGCVVSEVEDWAWAPDRAEGQIRSHLGVHSLAGFGLQDLAVAVGALGGMLHYVQTYQPGIAGHLRRIQTYSLSDYMVLDEFTRLNLELTQNLRDRTAEGSLLEVLDATLTPMGGRLLRQRLGQPLLDAERIRRRLDAVEQLFEDGIGRRGLREKLVKVGDLDRWTQRVVYGTALPRDLIGMRQALEALPAMKDLAEGMDPGPVSALVAELPDAADMRRLLQMALPDDPPAVLGRKGLIRPGYDPELDALMRQGREAHEALARMEASERKRLDMPRLKVGFNRVFGFYLEIPRSRSDEAPPEYVRKQTLAGAERFVTEELKALETSIQQADERQLSLEQQLYEELLERLRQRQTDLMEISHGLAELDVSAALAATADESNYVRPELTSDFALRIKGGRHPVVERSLTPGSFVPNDLEMDRERAVHILTGPNMAGKSTYLRQTALIVLMAQIGSFVPARAARIGIADRIFTRIGASDAIQRGMSTFMVEMIETAHILNHATARSLLILDEIGRGTSTYDGLAIAWAILEYIHSAEHMGAKTLFATHFHELTDLAARLPRIRNSHAAVDETGDRIAFLHLIRDGCAERSFGVHVGRMAGLPLAVVERAETILGQLEASGAAVPASVETIWDRAAAGQAVQPALYMDDHPAVAALRELEVDSLTPLDALNQLYALARLAREPDPAS